MVRYKSQIDTKDIAILHKCILDVQILTSTNIDCDHDLQTENNHKIIRR